MNYIRKKIKYLKFKNHIKKIDIKKVKRFSFEGVKKYGYIVSCYDGDTCTVLFRWKKQDIKLSCRIYGIDTPELRTKNEEEKKKAIEARDFLSNLILKKIIFINFMKYDKYGRPLVKLFVNNKDVSKIMIDNGFAKEYYGGAKIK